MSASLISIGLPIALILIMTGVGLGLTKADFTRIFQEPRGFIIGAIAQMLFLPVVAIAIISAFGLTGELAIGLFILSLCPGGTTSNLYSYLAKADVGLSVSLTAVIGLITPFTIPFLGAWAIQYYADSDKVFELPVISTGVKLLVLSVVPVMVGMLIRAKWTSVALRAEPYISKFAIFVLLAVIASICINSGSKLFHYAMVSGPAAIALNLGTMLMGYLLGQWLLHKENQARTICLEVGLQNGTLALLITKGLLESSEMSMAPSIYSLFMFISASLFTFWVLRKDRSQA